MYGYLEKSYSYDHESWVADLSSESKSPGFVLAKSLFRSWKNHAHTSSLASLAAGSTAKWTHAGITLTPPTRQPPAPASRASPSAGKPLDLKEPRPQKARHATEPEKSYRFTIHHGLWWLCTHNFFVGTYLFKIGIPSQGISTISLLKSWMGTWLANTSQFIT